MSSLQNLLNPPSSYPNQFQPGGYQPQPAAPQLSPPIRYRQQCWLIVGATRGIGLEFVTQLLAAGHRVVATARKYAGGNDLWRLTGTPNGKNLAILECDITNEESVERFIEDVRKMGRIKKGRAGGVEWFDVVVMNAGVLVYPNRAMECSYQDWQHHLTTNTIGPLMVAQKLLRLSPQPDIRTMVFMSSDSGSTAKFRAFEDGFAAYAASKAALNQGLRHLSAEVHRLCKQTETPEPQSYMQNQPQSSPFYSGYPPQNQQQQNQYATPQNSDLGHHRTSSNHSSNPPFPSPLSPLHPNPYAPQPPPTPQAQQQSNSTSYATSTNRSSISSSSSSHSNISPTPPPAPFRPFPTTILALHPGEVKTDMANIAVDWEVEGIITPEESVRCMLRVIDEKGWGGVDDSGCKSGGGRRGEASFWTWEGRGYPW